MVLKQSPIHSAFTTLLLFTFLGHGPVLQGMVTLLSLHCPVCRSQGDHCLLARSHKYETPSQRCHKQQSHSPAKPRCELRAACTHQHSALNSGDLSLRFLPPQAVALIAPEAGFPVNKGPTSFLKDIVFSPPDPPPRPPASL